MSGRPTSSSRCASHSRSKPCSKAPRNTKITTISTRIGLARTTRAPSPTVRSIVASVSCSRAPPRRNPSSGIATTSATASTSAVPPATNGSRRSASARATAATIPSKPVTRPTWAPRWYDGPSRSLPTSSASQASSAPLRNVHPTPHSAMPAITQPAEESSPMAIMAMPETTAATTIESRRLQRSATTAVGISKQK
ncbi:hypothetical protein EKO23_13795 [Nocardioides guangzhouensis]|uniref:Uncharacterized protein n=1 Tax=Nocardioides guangzhouensis TaxID=2497878 RepID=A0A4Q4ZAX7_9ACTN|nr:hypothetical protein [Nocardioides guangzhouensis]RYP85053.1 hypothetical protein EKO23_13795 [Nocardioides guangzhouensis]